MSEIATQRSDRFADRLTLAMKVLNFSRGQLAAAVGVDKSLVSRWLSGQVRPSGHNMARISAALSKLKPGFNMVLWDGPRDEFEAFLGLFRPEAPPAAPHSSPPPASARRAGGLRRIARALRPQHGAATVALGGLALVALAGGALILPVLARHGSSKATPGRMENAAAGSRDAAAPAHSIAVLPFANLSGDPAQNYFCDGIAEEISNALVRFPEMKVIGRRSAFAFKGRNEDLRSIGRALGVRELVEGSVWREGDRVRISVQLVRAEDGATLWSRSFDRKLSDMLKVQEEIAESIADTIEGRTFGVGRVNDVPTTSAAAYDLLLRATAEDAGPGTSYVRAQRAIADLEKAVSIDPKFSRAWAMLGRYYEYREQERIGAHGYSPSTLVQEERAARHALAIDPKSDYAYADLAAVAYHRGDLTTAEDDYLKALSLNPSLFRANDDYGSLLADVGHLDEAALHFAQAHDKVGDSSGASSDYGFVLFLLDPRSTSARVLIDVAVQLDPGHYRARHNRLVVDLAQGGLDAALDDQRIIDSLTPSLKARKIGEGLVAVARNSGALRSYLRSVAPEAAELYAQNLDLTPWALQAGDADLATEMVLKIETDRIRAGDRRGFKHILAPQFAPVRRDPRIKAMIAQIGLPKYWRARGWPKVCHPLGDADFACE